MKILVLNCGSSSLKYQLIDMENEQVLAKGNYERIGENESFLTHKIDDKKYIVNNSVANHEDAIKIIIKQLLHNEYGVINSLDEINGIGHRVVHGGEIFDKPVVIDEIVIEQIQQCAVFAPLHNPAAVLGMKACNELFENIKMVAVFDTAFHQTLEKEQYLYPIPYEYYKKYGIRKYGAHGTSHSYVSKRYLEIINKNIEDLKIITCHLGQGSSICAIKNGKSMNTSMGLTPLGGIPMVTRSGDLDPSVVTYIMEKENISAKDMNNVLNKKSGLWAISKLVPDFREIEKVSSENEQAKLAIDIFVNSICEYIARYAVNLEGVDTIIFTGGIGENQIDVRKQICDKLRFLGAEIDYEKNNQKGEEIRISTQTSKIDIWIIPTNEELVIAKETERLINC